MCIKKVYGDSVELVHRTLEMFKYVGGLCNGRSTGEGVDVSIVLLPDLLLDFRTQYINDPQTKTCTVGGRSARVACALLHLQSREDELFQCYLITKTGNLGVLLLSNEFDGTTTEDIFEAKYKDYIIQRHGEPRCAMVSYVNGTVNIVSPTPLPGDELSRDELEKHPDHKSVIRNADTLYFSSLRHPGFLDLLRLVVDGSTLDNGSTPEAGGPAIFIDLSRVHRSGNPSAMQDLSNYFESIKGEKLKRFGGIFVPTDVENWLGKNGYGTPEVLAQTFNVPVITYGEHREHVSVYDVNTDVVAEVQKLCIDFNHEGVLERFKAGVLLAYATRRALEKVAVTDGSLYLYLQKQWGDDSTPQRWETILRYGVSLAASVKNQTSDLSPLEALFSSVCDNDFVHYPSTCTVDLSALEFLTEGTSPISLASEKLPNATLDLARLSGYRRKQVFEQDERLSRLPFCINPKCSGGCRQVEDEDAKAAILFDLDSTLLDSALQKDRCLRRVMKLFADKADRNEIRTDTLFDIPNLSSENTTDKLLRFFNKYVYDMWPLYSELGLGDFRQKLNIGGWYVTFILLLSDSKTFNWVSGIEECLRPEPAKESRIDPEAARIKNIQEHESSDVRDFMRSYSRTKSQYASVVTQAQHNFSEGSMFAYKEAFDLLETLRQVKAFNLYVVSEGDPETQWMKIHNTGLSEYFDKNRVLTTGEASHPEAEMDVVKKMLDFLEKQVDVKRQQWGQLKASFDFLGELERRNLTQKNRRRLNDEVFKIIVSDILNLDQEKDSITSKQAMLENDIELLQLERDSLKAYQQIIWRMNKKKLVTFYAGVVRAIMRNPENPRDEFSSFDRLVKELPAGKTMKFAIIGDREDNDILPPMELLGSDRILTIRMKSKKYADQKSALQKPPMACVTTLSQAKALLLSSHVWDRVKCVDDPPFFQCTLNLSPPSPGPDSSGRREMPNSDSPQLVIGIDYVLCGIGMIEYRSIHDIFAGILSEYLNQETTTDEERQRTSKIILEETESQRDERRIKNNLLIISAVVNGHSLHRFGREDIAVKMVDSLISSIRQAVEPASGIVVAVLQEVKLALRTLSEDTQLDPKVRQKCRNEYLNLHTRMEKYI